MKSQLVLGGKKLKEDINMCSNLNLRVKLHFHENGVYQLVPWYRVSSLRDMKQLRREIKVM